jgi:putative tricarboxylic transport membrane protein
MKYGDCWAGGLVAVLGIIAIRAAWPLEFWSEFGPGPGFFPILLGSALILMGSMVGVDGWRRDRGQAGSSGSLRKPLVVAAIMAGYLAVLNPLGFVVATVAFLFTVIHWVESRGRWLALGLAVFITLGLHLVFGFLLKIDLPPGILKWIS